MSGIICNQHSLISQQVHVYVNFVVASPLIADIIVE